MKQEFRIMVVDDSRTSREIIISELKNDTNFKVADFDTVEAALKAIDTFNPEFIISDVNMPYMDGYDFCRCVRQHSKYEKIPFVILSANVNDEIKNKAIQMGVTTAFSKSFKPFELFKYVSRYVASHRNSYDYSVLLVDDDRISRTIIKKCLSEMSLKVFEVTNANEAEQIIEKFPVDLILLDYLMPGKTGIEWCKELRKSDEYKWIPILGLSSDDKFAMSFIKAGADDYLPKEFFQEEVIVRVQNLLKRVSLTKELNKALQKEQALNQQKNKLLGIAAHDIRNPLGVISGYVKLIMNGKIKDEETLKQCYLNINNAIENSLDLLNDILDVASIKSGVIELDKTVFPLDELLKERVSFMNEIGKEKEILGSVINKLNKKTKVLIEGDKKRLSQVIDNLISNAIKYSEKNSNYEIILDQQVEGWLIEVKDSGQGIPKDELLGIFDEFKRTSVKATAGESSTGLGLAIVKKLVTLHGGTIWIDSVLKEGTTVSFILPRFKE